MLAARHGGKASQRGWEARLGAEASSPDGYSSEGGGGGGGGAGVEIISSIRLFPRKQRGCAPARRQEGEGDARDGAPARTSRRRLPSSGLLCGRPAPRVGPSAQQIFLKVGGLYNARVPRPARAKRRWRHSIIKTFFSFCVLNQLAVVWLLALRAALSIRSAGEGQGRLEGRGGEGEAGGDVAAGVQKATGVCCLMLFVFHVVHA